MFVGGGGTSVKVTFTNNVILTSSVDSAYMTFYNVDGSKEYTYNWEVSPLTTCTIMVPGEIFADGAWGMILYIQSSLLADNPSNYELQVYEDQSLVGSSSCQQLSQNAVQFAVIQATQPSTIGLSLVLSM